MTDGVVAMIVYCDTEKTGWPLMGWPTSSSVRSHLRTPVCESRVVTSSQLPLTSNTATVRPNVCIAVHRRSGRCECRTR